MDRENLKNEDINNDLPKELTEFLNKNHPLKGEAEENVVRDRSHEEHYGRKEAEERKNSARKIEKENNVKERNSSMFEAIKNRTLMENSIKEEKHGKEDTPDEHTKKIDVSQIKKEKKEFDTNLFRETIQDDFDDELPEKYAPTDFAEKKEDDDNPIFQEKPIFNDIKYGYNVDEPVQLVKHKSRDKANRTAQKTSSKTVNDRKIFDFEASKDDDFEELSETISKNKKDPEISEKKKNFMHKHEGKNVKKQDRGAVLDSFFYDNDNEDYEDDDKKINYTKYAVIGVGVFVFLFIFFAIRTISLSSQLIEAKDKIATFSTIQEENETLKMYNLALEEEIKKYAAGGYDPSAEDNKTSENGEGGSGTTSTEFDTYTVVPGDTFGSISTKVYGNFSGYKKIMEANGITDEGGLQIGQKLKIPKN